MIVFSQPFIALHTDRMKSLSQTKGTLHSKMSNLIKVAKLFYVRRDTVVESM